MLRCGRLGHRRRQMSPPASLREGARRRQTREPRNIRQNRPRRGRACTQPPAAPHACARGCSGQQQNQRGLNVETPPVEASPPNAAARPRPPARGARTARSKRAPGAPRPPRAAPPQRAVQPPSTEMQAPVMDAEWGPQRCTTMAARSSGFTNCLVGWSASITSLITWGKGAASRGAGGACHRMRVFPAGGEGPASLRGAPAGALCSGRPTTRAPSGGAARTCSSGMPRALAVSLSWLRTRSGGGCGGDGMHACQHVFQEGGQPGRERAHRPRVARTRARAHASAGRTREHVSRADRVAGDVLARQLERDRLCEPRDAMLRRVVGRLVGGRLRAPRACTRACTRTRVCRR